MFYRLSEWAQTHWIQASLVGLFVVITLSIIIRHQVKISNFIREVIVELKKCTWPWDPAQTGLRRYKELIDSLPTTITLPL